MNEITTIPALGVDIGRVLIDGPRHPGGGDTAFFTGDEATMLATPEVPGAVDALARLVDVFGGRVWLVSKCGQRVQDRTLRWLAGHDVHARTGLDPGHVRFCRTRPAKREHCEALGLTHFVDDHPEVHAAIRGAVREQYLFGGWHVQAPPYARLAPTWADVERLVAESLSPNGFAPTGRPVGRGQR